MTNHGFGKANYSKIDPKDIAETAGKISEVRGVVWTHVVKNEVADYNIIFEFGHPRKYDRTLDSLVKEIREIARGARKIDIYIIQSSYKG